MNYPADIFVTGEAEIVDDKDTDDSLQVVTLQHELEYMKHRLMDIEDRTTRTQYVSAEEFEPMRKIVYGLISMILIAVIGSLISLTISA